MSKYSVIKSELKALASQIRSLKASFKTSQRESHGGGDWNIRGEQKQLSFDYRHMHLAYGLIRGRTMEQMEAKVAEGNEPSMAYVEKLVKELESKVIVEVRDEAASISA
jgi:hypothetical protein